MVGTWNGESGNRYATAATRTSREPPLGHHWHIAGDLTELFGLLAEGAIEPHIDRTFAVDDATQAHERLEASEA